MPVTPLPIPPKAQTPKVDGNHRYTTVTGKSHPTKLPKGDFENNGFLVPPHIPPRRGNNTEQYFNSSSLPQYNPPPNQATKTI
jgi:hypothetical protein